MFTRSDDQSSGWGRSVQSVGSVQGRRSDREMRTAKEEKHRNLEHVLTSQPNDSLGENIKNLSLGISKSAFNKQWRISNSSRIRKFKNKQKQTSKLRTASTCCTSNRFWREAAAGSASPASKWGPTSWGPRPPSRARRSESRIRLG